MNQKLVIAAQYVDSGAFFAGENPVFEAEINKGEEVIIMKEETFEKWVSLLKDCLGCTYRAQDLEIASSMHGGQQHVIDKTVEFLKQLEGGTN